MKEEHCFNPYPATVFFPDNFICMYTSAPQTSFFMEAKYMNPDQTAPRGNSLICAHIVCNVSYLRT